METYIQDQEFQGPPASLIHETIQVALTSIVSATHLQQ